MQNSTIAQMNKKGQVVIPKIMRESLAINENVPLHLILEGGGVHIYPIEDVILKSSQDNAYLSVLKYTQGAWVKDSWEKTRKQRKEIELKASIKRRKNW